MKRMTLTLLATVALCAPLAAAADNHAKPPNVGSVWVLTPGADVSTAAFEEAMKAHLAWRREAGDPRRWQTYVVNAGEDMGDYYVRACCFTWTDQDAYERWAYDAGAAAAYNEQVGGMVADISHQFQVIDTDNSNWNDDGGPYYYIGVTRWTPNPAKVMQMGATMGEMSALAKDNGWKYSWAWYRSLGGSDNLMLAVPYRNYADMEPPEQSFYEFAAQHMGEEDAAGMFQRFNESFWNSSYTIYRWREDLSMAMDDD